MSDMNTFEIRTYGGQVITQAGIKFNPMLQLAVSGFGTKIGTIELGKFGAPIGTDLSAQVSLIAAALGEP